MSNDEAFTEEELKKLLGLTPSPHAPSKESPKESPVSPKVSPKASVSKNQTRSLPRVKIESPKSGSKTEKNPRVFGMTPTVSKNQTRSIGLFNPFSRTQSKHVTPAPRATASRPQSPRPPRPQSPRATASRPPRPQSPRPPRPQSPRATASSISKQSITQAPIPPYPTLPRTTSPTLPRTLRTSKSRFSNSPSPNARNYTRSSIETAVFFPGQRVTYRETQTRYVKPLTSGYHRIWGFDGNVPHTLIEGEPFNDEKDFLSKELMVFSNFLDDHLRGLPKTMPGYTYVYNIREIVRALFVIHVLKTKVTINRENIRNSINENEFISYSNEPDIMEATRKFLKDLIERLYQCKTTGCRDSHNILERVLDKWNL